jgi:uncharacterized protein YlxW (UPF0749 family)
MARMVRTDHDATVTPSRRQAHSSTVAPPRRVDASMTLLTEVMQRPLDPGYAAAAAAKRAGGSGHRRPSVLVATLLVAVLCGAVSAAAVRELRTPQPGVVQARKSLERQVALRDAAADRLQSSNEQLRVWIAGQQATALAAGGSNGLAQRSRDQGVLTGELSASGPGLALTLDDAEGVDASGGSDPRADAGSDQGRVLDRDLQIVVNGLWAAGAEAISVNGERLTALSAIRSAGQAILVDFRPLSPPYVVQAIGNAATMQANFAADMSGPYLQSLTSNYGIRAGIEAKGALTLPAAGSLSLHYAHRPGASSGSGTAPPTTPPTSGGGSSSAPASSPANPEVSK